MTDSLSPAGCVLAAYDALHEVKASEPDSDGEPESWLVWHESEYLPASAAYRTAVIHFQGANGSFHPANVLPAAVAAMGDSDD